MQKSISFKLLVQIGLSVVPAICLAETPEAVADAVKAGAEAVPFFTWTVTAAILGLAIAAAICGLAQARVVDKAVEGIARQPETSGQIQTAMILGLAFIESLVIYVLLIALILLFFNPFTQYLIR
ncbi:MAG: ATP synthase F0 subunit C [Elusimicrobiota bacterium]